MAAVPLLLAGNMCCPPGRKYVLSALPYGCTGMPALISAYSITLLSTIDRPVLIKWSKDTVKVKYTISVIRVLFIKYYCSVLII
jgi:hypothetical protein